MPRTITTAFLLLLASSSAWSQSGDLQQPQPSEAAVSTPLLTPPPDSEPTPTGGELPYSDPLSPPAIASGVRPPLTIGSEGTRSNFISGDFQIVAGFDDNPLGTSSDRINDFSYLLAAGFTMAQTRERWNCTLAYNPGFTINQRLSERNQSSQNLSADLRYRLSPHVTLRLVDTFEKTSNAFSGVMANPLVSESGPLQGPNRSVITPLAQHTGNTTSMDLGYQFSASSMIGGGTTYYLTNYDNIASPISASTSLIDTRSIAVDGYYAHRFANRQWFGARYGFQRLTFDQVGQTTIHRMLMFYAVPFHSSMSLSAWAGPEYSLNDVGLVYAPTLPRSASRWSGVGGAAYDCSGQHTGFRAEYVRRISDGGGLTAAVSLQQADAALRQQWSPRWTTSLGVSYANNDPIQALVNSVGKIRVLSLTAGLNRQIRDNLSVGIQYGRDRQRYVDAAPTLGLVNRNRVLISLSYSFSRPFGR